MLRIFCDKCKRAIKYNEIAKVKNREDEEYLSYDDDNKNRVTLYHLCNKCAGKKKTVVENPMWRKYDGVYKVTNKKSKISWGDISNFSTTIAPPTSDDTVLKLVQDRYEEAVAKMWADIDYNFFTNKKQCKKEKKNKLTADRTKRLFNFYHEYYLQNEKTEFNDEVIVKLSYLRGYPVIRWGDLVDKKR